jgi:hypothetical protein
MTNATKTAHDLNTKLHVVARGNYQLRRAISLAMALFGDGDQRPLYVAQHGTTFIFYAGVEPIEGAMSLTSFDIVEPIEIAGYAQSLLDNLPPEAWRARPYGMSGQIGDQLEKGFSLIACGSLVDKARHIPLAERAMFSIKPAMVLVARQPVKASLILDLSDLGTDEDLTGVNPN